MNARFWVYHSTAFVKLTLKPGQTLSHYQSWQTDEGWSSIATGWEYNGGTVFRESVDDGRDCDGRLTRRDYCCCFVANLHARVIEDAPPLPDWTDVQSSQRDYSAEAMGY